MYIKIYFGNKPVFLCDAIDDTLRVFQQHPDTIFLEGLSGSAIKSLIHEIAKPDCHAGILLHAPLEALKKAFWKHFTLIKAGGGLVYNESGEVLLIFRRGLWDLPKGKLDPGETIEQCALREVREETGIQGATLGDSLGLTYHTYNDYGHFVLKETYWYRMRSTTAETLVPQVTEDIHDIRWVAPALLSPYLDNTYPSIKDILAKA